jgi:membrane-associated phospholipid phosphatase
MGDICLKSEIHEFIQAHFSISGLLKLLLVFALACIFLELAGDVWLREGFSWDRPILLAIHQAGTPLFDFLFRMISVMVGILIPLPLGLICYWFWYHQMRHNALTIVFSVIGMSIMTTLLKLIFQRPRPEVFPPLVTETSYSFPSGHTGSAVALFGLAGIYFWRANRRLYAVFCWIWVPLVMLSRVYLGVHYPSDVLASLALGIIWIIILTVQSGNNLMKQG